MRDSGISEVDHSHHFDSHVEIQEARAVAAMPAFLASLTPAERAALKSCPEGAGVGYRDDASADAHTLPDSFHDTAEDVFEECLMFERASAGVTFPGSSGDFARRVFARFWAEWSQIENVPSHASGEEAVIALLQTMTGSKTEETRLQAYCYLLAIGRTPKTQGEVAEMFYPKEGKKYRATINARVTDIREDLQLIQARGMKSNKAREIYSKKTQELHNKRIEHPCSKKPSMFRNFVSKLPMTAPRHCEV